jgi:hypothetical protein
MTDFTAALRRGKRRKMRNDAIVTVCKNGDHGMTEPGCEECGSCEGCCDCGEAGICAALIANFMENP